MKHIYLPISFTIACLIFTIDNHATPPGHRAFCGFSLHDGYYYDDKPLQFITHEAKAGDKSGIPDVVDAIEKKIGFDVPISVFIAQDEANCSATIGQGGVRMLIADYEFLNQVNNVSKTRWAAISIIAHEIGHHIAGFNRHSSRLDGELDADYWSGYALQKLGSNREAAIKCIMKFGTEEDTDSHPNKYSRAKMIEKGWDDAQSGEIDYSKCQDCN